MASDREALSTLLRARGVIYPENAAAVAVAGGWRPPARVISEAETQHLLPGAIVRRDGKAWEREHGMWWHAGVLAPRAVPYGSGPITVLYDPAEETDQ